MYEANVLDGLECVGGNVCIENSATSWLLPGKK